MRDRIARLLIEALAWSVLGVVALSSSVLLWAMRDNGGDICSPPRPWPPQWPDKRHTWRN